MKLTKEECIRALNGLVTDHKIASKTVRNKCIIEQLIDEHFKKEEIDLSMLEEAVEKYKNEPPYIPNYDWGEQLYISQLEKALSKACKLLKKAGVVYGKENGKPIRLSPSEWFLKLLEDARNELL